MVGTVLKFSVRTTLFALGGIFSVNAATLDLRIMETTDMHGNMMDYDYYQDKASDKFGLVRAASLIDAARKEVLNSVLVDNGDVIQGSPMADYRATKGLKDGEIHPVYKAMNMLDYKVAWVITSSTMAWITSEPPLKEQNSPTSTPTFLMRKRISPIFANI